MPQIKLQFSAQNTIFSQLIRWRDWSDYSHSEFVLSDGTLLGADIDGVKIRSPYQVKRKLVLSVDVTSEQHREIMATALSQVGKDYDFGGVAGFVTNRDWQDDSKWFCWELIAYCFMQAGVPLLRFDNLHRVSSSLMLSPLLRE
jgi:uncharacterized protein YycO